MFVHDVADGPDTGFKHAVCGGVGHHQSGQTIGVLFRLFFQTVQVDVAAFIALHRHDPHSGHHRTGRVGPVSGHRNQAHVALLVLRPVKLSNCQQTGQFSLRTGIRLNADGGESRTGRQP